MPNSQLAELAQLTRMQPTQRRPDWSAVRAMFGFDMPADYMALIDNFGAGEFNYYVEIFGPDEKQKVVNLKESGLYWDRFFTVEWERRPQARPARLQDRTITIINWGSTEDAVQFFWIADPSVNSDQWEVAFHTHEGETWEFFDQSTVEVLLAFVRGELRSSLLKPRPDEAIVYTPYP